MPLEAPKRVSRPAAVPVKRKMNDCDDSCSVQQEGEMIFCETDPTDGAEVAGTSCPSFAAEELRQMNSSDLSSRFYCGISTLAPSETSRVPSCGAEDLVSRTMLEDVSNLSFNSASVSGIGLGIQQRNFFDSDTSNNFENEPAAAVGVASAGRGSAARPGRSALNAVGRQQRPIHLVTRQVGPRPCFCQGCFAGDAMSALEREVEAQLLLQEYMLMEPLSCRPNPASAIKIRHRSSLVDWIAHNCYRFCLSDRSIYVSVNLIDRYLSAAPQPRDCAQEVAACCLWIASKYEDIQPPSTADIVRLMSDDRHRCSYSSLRARELSILKAVSYSLTKPLVSDFVGIGATAALRYYNALEGNYPCLCGVHKMPHARGRLVPPSRISSEVADVFMRTTNYFCDASMYHPILNATYPPSLIAAAVIALAELTVILQRQSTSFDSSYRKEVRGFIPSSPLSDDNTMAGPDALSDDNTMAGPDAPDATDANTASSESGTPQFFVLFLPFGFVPSDVIKPVELLLQVHVTAWGRVPTRSCVGCNTSMATCACSSISSVLSRSSSTILSCRNSNKTSTFPGQLPDPARTPSNIYALNLRVAWFCTRHGAGDTEDAPPVLQPSLLWPSRDVGALLRETPWISCESSRSCRSFPVTELEVPVERP